MLTGPAIHQTLLLQGQYSDIGIGQATTGFFGYRPEGRKPAILDNMLERHEYIMLS